MNKVDFSQFTPSYFEGESQIIALMEHVASGAPNQWAVYTNGNCLGVFSDYDEANRVFDEADASLQPSLHLYTRVGTSVLFRYKDNTHE